VRKHPIKLFAFLTLCLTGLAILLTTYGDRDHVLKLAGNNRTSLMRSNTPQRQESIAWHCADLLREGRYSDVIQLLQPGVVGAETRQSLTAIHHILTEREPVSVKVIDAQKFRGEGDVEITNIVLDYEFPSTVKKTSSDTELLPAKWVFVTFSIRSIEDSITGIHAVTSEQSIEAINAFTFKNKGVSQYTAFAAGILLNAFAIYAITLCVTAKIGPKKWLWTLLMLFTFVLVSVNWTTGDWSFGTVSLGFKLPPLPANVECSAYGPWNLARLADCGHCFCALSKEV
jgi:hypothetical protein